MNDRWWFKLSGNLGAIYPTYNIRDPSFLSLEIKDILADETSNNRSLDLDLAALAGKVCLPYLLGNRTLIKGVRRAPWMSEYKGNGHWQSCKLPVHGSDKPEPEIFTLALKDALLDEAKTYLENKKTVGILLSGGLDSRVAAGVLRELQLRGGGIETVVALTWGAEDCRDVIYAQRIAQSFNWDMVHFSITVETLAKNIENSGIAGAEVSPLHLHAMADVAKLEGIDAIIAGSYGDSVGRAEFSGRHLTDLRCVLPKVLDPFGLLKGDAVSRAKKELKQDLVDKPQHLSINQRGLKPLAIHTLNQ